MNNEFQKNYWAFILGGSSGFGLATAKKLISKGMNIFLVHRDRRGAMEKIEKEFDSLKNQEANFVSLNINALSEEGQAEILAKLDETLGSEGKVRIFLHSIAFGNLKPIVKNKNQPDSRPEEIIQMLSEKLNAEPSKVKDSINEIFNQGGKELYPFISSDYGERLLAEEDFSQTIYSMGTSFLSWVQKIHQAKLFSSDARVIGLTSEGNEIAWRGYAAVAAAKVALESVSRAVALEFAPYGIRSNIIQAGITDTPAMRLIPGSQKMKASAELKNPFKKLTQTSDVANVIYLLSKDEASWINGTIIRVDGGEHIASE